MEPEVDVNDARLDLLALNRGNRMRQLPISVQLAAGGWVRALMTTKLGAVTTAFHSARGRE